MEPIATEGRPDFSNYGLIAKKIMQKMGYDLENPVGLKNGKGLDEGTKAGIRRRGGYQLSDVRPGSLIMERQTGRNLKLMSRTLQKAETLKLNLIIKLLHFG